MQRELREVADPGRKGRMELDNVKVGQIRHKIIDIIHQANRELKNLNLVIELKKLLEMMDEAINGR